MTKPYPTGTLIHHRGAIHSRNKEPKYSGGGLRGGWGEVLQSVEQSDGTFEYEVKRERDIAGVPCGDSKAWWASYHIDKVVEP